jgi:hypothetical protein
MRITALKSATKLPEDFYLETDSTPTGVIVTVYDAYKQLIGQFTNNRQGVGDKRPLENVIAYDKRMFSVVDYFSL